LKRRLEDLERRAGTSDGSSSSEKQTGSGSNGNKSSAKKQSGASKPHKSAAPMQKAVQPPQFTPPMQTDDEFLMPPTYDDRERSHTPPFMPYSSYPPPDEMLMAPYGSAQPYQAMTTAEAYPTYMATTVPCTLPSMTHFSDAIKRETYPGEESMPSYMNYGFVPGMEVHAPNPYDQSNPHVSHVRHHQSPHHHQRNQ
jgi:hypothetical protein